MKLKPLTLNVVLVAVSVVISAAAMEFGIRLLFPAFQAAFKEDPSKAWAAANDPHPSAPAHKILGDVLFDFLSPKIN